MTPEELFDKYHNLPYWYLYNLLPTKANDEDYQQVAFIGLWRACLGYDDTRDASFTTYSIRCIRNELCRYHHYLHRDKREGDLYSLSLDMRYSDNSNLGDDEGSGSLMESLEDPDSLRDIDRIFDRDFLEYLRGKVRITDTQRRMIDLIVEGKSPGEVVKELGITRQRVHQIKRDLKEKFSREYYR